MMRMISENEGNRYEGAETFTIYVARSVEFLGGAPDVCIDSTYIRAYVAFGSNDRP